jgi:Tfp pilus assembly protein PilV
MDARQLRGTSGYNLQLCRPSTSSSPCNVREASQMVSLARRNRSTAGFSLVELLIAAVLACVFFAAMVPVIANDLKATSRDEYRVDTANIAQDRLEQVRLLDYADITSSNLNYSPAPTASPFGDGRFGSTYTLIGETRPYKIDYVVDPASSATAAQKRVKVSVYRVGSYVTSAETVIQNPEAGGSTSTSAPSPSALPNLSLTIYFDTWSYVKSPGVIVQCVQTNVTPFATTTPTPTSAMPNSSKQELTWTGLTGGPNYTYTVFCNSTKASYVLTAPSFRLWRSGRLKFDTYPGGD